MADRASGKEIRKVADGEQQRKYPKSARNGEHRPKRSTVGQRTVENCR